MIGEYIELWVDNVVVAMMDDHGNVFQELLGPNRIFTPEQLQKVIARPHSERGCCCDKFGCHG